MTNLIGALSLIHLATTLQGTALVVVLASVLSSFGPPQAGGIAPIGQTAAADGAPGSGSIRGTIEEVYFPRLGPGWNYTAGGEILPLRNIAVLADFGSGQLSAGLRMRVPINRRFWVAPLIGYHHVRSEVTYLDDDNYLTSFVQQTNVDAGEVGAQVGLGIKDGMDVFVGYSFVVGRRTGNHACLPPIYVSADGISCVSEAAHLAALPREFSMSFLSVGIHGGYDKIFRCFASLGFVLGVPTAPADATYIYGAVSATATLRASFGIEVLWDPDEMSWLKGGGT